METIKLDKVLTAETEALVERRKRLFGEEAAAEFEKDKFGIALSGGGIRSATINLGFLRTLNLFNILEKADYLSTVSGGGYVGAYVQTTVKEKSGYDGLFGEDKIAHLRNYGAYLIPGQKRWDKLWNTLLLTVGFVVSWAMSLLSPATVVAMGYLIFRALGSLTQLELAANSPLNWDGGIFSLCMECVGWTLLGVFGIHFFSNLLFNFHLSISKIFNRIETCLLLAVGVYVGLAAVLSHKSGDPLTNEQVLYFLLGALGFYVAGYLLNPNSLSFHRYYRKQLSDTFLSHIATFKNLKIKDVFRLDGERQDYLAPYPLVNTCLNLQNPGGEDKFKGAKASDYFLLSPLFCGSKLSNYVKTAEFPGFRHLTLPAALTISAAAVNPGMGVYSNKFLSVMMTLFNARLGFWVNNPLSKPRNILPEWTKYIVWWPSYFFKELLGKIGTTNRKLNISDGGHIENLAVYELLRRKCRLIVAVDAGADPLNTFLDLENLSIRARNELGIDIAFRDKQDPVDVIRPKPSSGYAQKRFSIADLLKIWEEFPVLDEQGQPIKFISKQRIGGRILEREAVLEALVNYGYSKEDPDYLVFMVDLKAVKDFEIPAEAFERYKKIATEMVRSKLDAQPHLRGMEKIKMGTLVYIKSSVTPPRKFFVPEYFKDGSKNYQFDTFKYKIYHPEFPHESTADQFFDPVQWESYYQLGQYIGSDVLGTPLPPEKYERGKLDFSIAALIEHFDQRKELFDKSKAPEGLVDVSTRRAKVQPEGMEEELELADSRSVDAAPSAETEPAEEALVQEMQFKI